MGRASEGPSRRALRAASRLGGNAFMEALDLSVAPPRSPHEELDGLVFLPRTIDKLRALLPGGNPGVYFINGKILGMSGYLLERLGIAQAELLEAVAAASNDEDIAAWLRSRTDVTRYGEIGATIRKIKPKHTADPAYFAELYSETIALHPELERIIDIVAADDRRMFPSSSNVLNGAAPQR